jgi:hypothetical protein
VIALFVLPVERRASRRPNPAPMEATAARQRRPDHGSVPASALHAKVILPPSPPEEPARSAAGDPRTSPTQRER